MDTFVRRGLLSSSLLPILAVSLTACGPTDTDEPSEQLGEAQSAVAVPGPWEIPAQTLAIGDEQHVDYTGAGDWVGEAGCGGGILSGTDILRDYLYAHFPQTNSIGGYACRAIVGNPNKMSVHATGRALDIMIPTVSGDEADNTAGDAIGNWLVENAEAIGIQYIIWDLYTWQAERDVGNKGKDYGGSHPHHDHLHIEVSVEMSTQTTNWFEDDVETPAIEGCAPMAWNGGTFDEADECFGAFGNQDFWRVEAGAGQGGSLMWTNAWENDTPGNWARWNLVFSSRGTYDIEVYIDPAWGVHQATRYVVAHADGETTVEIDQSTQHEWVSLGQFDFNAGGDQHVSVYDNYDFPVADDQRIVVDAVRATRSGGYKPPSGFEPEGVDDEGGAEDPDSGGTGDSNRSFDDAEDGCTISAPGQQAPVPLSAWGLGLAVAALGATMRRRRR